MKLRRRMLLAAFATLPAAWAIAAGPVVGQVIAIKGAVFRERAGRREPAGRGTPLEIGDAVATEAGGKAKLQLNDGTIISVSENARLVVSEYQSTGNDYTTRVRAEAGAMRFLFLRSLDFSGFEVETETAVAAVRGTEWVMDVRPAHTAIVMLRGSLVVTGHAAPGSEVVLEGAGQGTDIRAGQPPTPPARWGAQRFAATLARATFED